MLLILIFLMSAILAILVVGGASLYLSIHYKLNQMATKQEFLDGFAVLSESLDSIETSSKNTEADVKKLLETIDGGGISAVDENELVEVLKAIGDRSKAVSDLTKAISDIVPDPAPEEPTDGEG